MKASQPFRRIAPQAHEALDPLRSSSRQSLARLGILTAVILSLSLPGHTSTSEAQLPPKIIAMQYNICGSACHLGGHTFKANYG